MLQNNRRNFSRGTNDAHFNKNELTGQYCEKCGSPMIAVEWDGSWFAGCSNYPDCRSTATLPKTKPLLNAQGEQVHPQAVENANAFRTSNLRRQVDEISKRLDELRNSL